MDFMEVDTSCDGLTEALGLSVYICSVSSLNERQFYYGILKFLWIQRYTEKNNIPCNWQKYILLIDMIMLKNTD